MGKGDKFLWGSATAAYQCEGAWDADGKGLGEWDEFSHGNPLNINGESGDVSCDFYHRYAEDFDLLEKEGQNSFRFSIAWDRILPEGRGDVNQAGIDFYNRLIDSCLEHGLEPNVTLFHYDLPAALAHEGGWERRGIADDFAQYAKICFEQFGDRVKLWATINEPRYYSYCTNLVGNYPPNHRLDFNRYFMVLYHELLASAKAVRIYHEMGCDGKIGIVHDSCNVELPDDTRNPQRVSDIANLFYTRFVLDTSILGEIPGALIPLLNDYCIGTSYMHFDDCLDFESGKVDWLGLNIYNRGYVTDWNGGGTEVFHNNLGARSNAKEGIRIANWFETAFDPTTKRNKWGREIYPDCAYNATQEVLRRYGDIPIYITENGHGEYETTDDDGYVDDPERIEMMQGYIDRMIDSIHDGCNIKGYYAWSPMDLYSWVNGYEKRYGLIHVDFKTQRRTPKRSYYWYQKIIASHQDLLAEYRGGSDD
jgi:6-phospho-beta-glucosidase